MHALRARGWCALDPVISNCNGFASVPTRCASPLRRARTLTQARLATRHSHQHPFTWVGRREILRTTSPYTISAKFAVTEFYEVRRMSQPIGRCAEVRLVPFY